jgi:hypothetical protein
MRRSGGKLSIWKMLRDVGVVGESIWKRNLHLVWISSASTLIPPSSRPILLCKKRFELEDPKAR